MIQINLLGVEQKRVAKAPLFNTARTLTAACSLILVAAGGGLGWWYWSLSREAARIDVEVAAAQREAARLKNVLADVQQFETRRAQLRERVALIEQLRGGQSVPVQLLDHVGRSLPEMLWLTSFEQDGTAVTLEGRSTTLIALSDFVRNLGAIPLLQKPVEIVDSQVETPPAVAGETPAELIRFTVKAQLVPVAKPKEPPAEGGRGAAPRRGVTTGRGQGTGA
jgi:type IV pilus assembly protein PilN